MGGATFNISILGGTNPGKKLLSCRADGLVDLFGQDDDSGRRKWSCVAVSEGLYNIVVAGGTNPGKRLLSCRADGHVDLFGHDDDSGRQKWRFVPVG